MYIPRHNLKCAKEGDSFMGGWGVALWAMKRIEKPGLFHWLAVPSGVLGFVAVITGWIVAEVGRQLEQYLMAFRVAHPIEQATVLGELQHGAHAVVGSRELGISGQMPVLAA